MLRIRRVRGKIHKEQRPPQWPELAHFLPLRFKADTIANEKKTMPERLQKTKTWGLSQEGKPPLMNGLCLVAAFYLAAVAVLIADAQEYDCVYSQRDHHQNH